MTGRYLRIPHFAEFFFETDGITRARFGLPIDASLHAGGMTLFFGARFSLVIDLDAIRALYRWRWAPLMATQ